MLSLAEMDPGMHLVMVLHSYLILHFSAFVG